MFYYTHNIGDYAIATSCMTFEEKGVYVDMVDRYISTGKPLDTQWLSIFKRKAGEDAVNNVLTLCFVERDGFFYREELDLMIAAYAKTTEKNRRNAQKRRKDVAPEPTGLVNETQTKPSGYPVGSLTDNQEPRTKRTTATTSSFAADAAEDPALQAPPDLPAEALWGDENPVPVDAEAPAAEKPKLAYPRCEYEKVVALYHEKCPGLQRVMANSDARRRTVGARWKDFCREDGYKTTAEVLDAFSWYFDRVAASPFLMGQSAPGFGRDRAFVADFDWLMKPTNFIKVCEGKYTHVAQK